MRKIQRNEKSKGKEYIFVKFNRDFMCFPARKKRFVLIFSIASLVFMPSDNISRRVYCRNRSTFLGKTV